MTEAHIPGFENDIFISYASVNNQSRSEEKADSGWISTLVNNLRIGINEDLGRKDSCQIWKDNRLLPGASLTDEITGNLQNSAIMLMFLSTGYLESDWCKKEKDIFLEMLRSKNQDFSNIIIIEKQKVDENDVPEELRDSLRISFWKTNDESLRSRTLCDNDPNFGKEIYWSKIDDLVTALSEKIKRLKNHFETQTTIPVTAPPGNGNYKGTIFLAEATDDLDPHREEVKRYLDQQGIQVLPDKCYPANPQEYKDVLVEDLKNSKLFVQLLSNVAGKRPQGVEKGYNYLQYDQARDNDLPVLQWFTPDQKIETVADSIQRELVELETVRQINLQSFKKDVVRKMNEIIKPVEKTPQPFNLDISGPNIFVNTSTHDIGLANDVKKIIKNNNMICTLPLLKEENADKIRRDLEDNLLFCDVIILIYGKDTLVWVREQLRNLKKINYKRTMSLQALAVCDGPPEDKECVNMDIPGMEIIDCRKGLNEEKLNAFLGPLKGDSHE